MKHLLAVLIGILISSQAAAVSGAVIGGKITQLEIDQDGRGIITFGQPIGGLPASCGTISYASAFAFNATTTGGKAILATALIAKTTSAAVAAYGSGVCSINNGWVEDLSELHIL